MANFCIVNGNGSKVTVEVTVDNGGQTGGKFWLWQLQGGKYVAIEKFQVSTNAATGLLSFTFTTHANSMEGMAMSWTINSCCRIPQTERLTIKIQL